MPAKKATPENLITILAFGDVVAKIGRRALAKVMPELKERFQPDFMLANVENLAHGKGVTRSTLNELTALGIDCFTSGNHIWKKPEVFTIMQDDSVPLIRPANYPATSPGLGARLFPIGAKQLLVINVQGQAFMQEQVSDPLRTVDEILQQHAREKNIAGTIVDFHGEVTSEKAAIGWYLNGRVSAVLGTHTHVPTADAWIMPGGTAFISDLGMSGARDSVIGVDKDVIIQRMLTQMPGEHTFPEHGPAVVDATVLRIDPSTGKAVHIEHVRSHTEV
ncbi:MAG: YmdB family metallophosphoesterase [Candidatus Nomurabacteria bacterium]|nr:MAG: YmdB family metallophosphoesterase [Candidatus Nomurabacteria bacterium]